MGNKKIISLFLASGCLKPETIRLYNDGDISGEALRKVNRHLEECPLCREAVDGYKIMPDFKEQEEAVHDIRKRMFRLLNEKHGLIPGEIKIRRVYKYIAAAASVILIAGVFSIYHFVLKQDNNMLADNIEAEEIVPETIPDKQLQTDSEPEVSVREKKEEADIIYADSPVKQPGGVEGKGGETEKSEMIEYKKQEEAEEQEVPEPDMKLAIQENISRQVSEIQVSGTEGDGIEKDAVLIDDSILYVISDVEQLEEQGQKKSAVASVAAQPESAAKQKKKSREVYEIDEETEIKPQFKAEGYVDFDDYIRKNIKYPEAASKKGIGGNVKVEFFVNKKGEVKKVSVVEGINEILNIEAIRVVSSSPRWIAAELDGKKLTRKMAVTVEFNLK